MGIVPSIHACHAHDKLTLYNHNVNVCCLRASVRVRPCCSSHVFAWSLVSREGREGHFITLQPVFQLLEKEAPFLHKTRAGVAVGRAVGGQGEGSWELQTAVHNTALLSIAIAAGAMYYIHIRTACTRPHNPYPYP